MRRIPPVINHLLAVIGFFGIMGFLMWGFVQSVQDKKEVEISASPKNVQLSLQAFFTTQSDQNAICVDEGSRFYLTLLLTQPAGRMQKDFIFAPQHSQITPDGVDMFFIPALQTGEGATPMPIPGVEPVEIYFPFGDTVYIATQIPVFDRFGNVLDQPVKKLPMLVFQGWNELNQACFRLVEDQEV